MIITDLTNTGGVRDSRRRMMMEKSDIIITSESNPKLLAILYSNGYCKHENFMTRKEAMGVKSLPRLLTNLNSNSTCPNSFDELRFFTGLTDNANSTVNMTYYASFMQSIIFPPHLTHIGNAVVAGWNNNKVVAMKRAIFSKNTRTIGNYFFYGVSQGGDEPVVCICKAVVPPTIGTTQARPTNIHLLYVPDESVTAYSEDSMWGQAQSILPISQCPREYGEYKGLIKGNALDE